MRIHLFAMVVSACLLASGCVQHISSYTPKQRLYAPQVDPETTSHVATRGSIFHPSSKGTHLFADQRAMRIGDIVTIRIKEEANAKRDASTDLGRKSSMNMELESFFGALKAINVPGISQGDLLKALFESEYKGEGETSRTEHLEATVPATVKKAFPNGNLFIEGHRVILVNNEEHHFYISGVIRAVDIEGDNSVASALVADAEIEFTGRGVISDKQRPGWLDRALDYVTPF